MTVRALSFDADQTLWDFRGVHQRALSATADAMVARGDVGAGHVGVEQLQQVRDEVVDRVRGLPHNLEDVRERSFEVFLERAGHRAPRRAARELIEIFLTIRFGAIKLYPEVRSSLTRLKATYKIGLLSNGNTYPDRCGLPGVFDAVVLGPGHGFAKPDRRAFDAIAHQLGVPLNSVMHIGDDHDDVGGANAAGAVSVFISRPGSDSAVGHDAHHEVQDLNELEALLATLTSHP